MDPFSGEGELLNVLNAFHQGDYQTVMDADNTSYSQSNATTIRILQLRAAIANGSAEKFLAETERQKPTEPDYEAVKALALLATGKTSEALRDAERLTSSSPDNATVQILAGTVLQAAGSTEEALALLTRHQGNLEAIALIVQIHLQQNRTDLALKEVQAARKWAQDSLLVNIAESWVGMRVGGEKYQQAFYVFEEMAQTPSSGSTSGTKSLVAQAVAEIHLGRLPEAEAALQQALGRDGEDVEAIANSAVLNTISGKDATEMRSSLQQLAPQHLLLTDLEEKSTLFDQAAMKYKARVAV